MKLSSYTKSLLDDIERRIDPETEEDFHAQWEAFFSDKCKDLVFNPVRKNRSAPGIELKPINISDALEDYDLMLADQMNAVSKRLNSKSCSLAIRSNYGTGIMTSLFGAEIFVMPKKYNTLPTTRSFNDTDKMREIVDAGIPNLNNGWGKHVFNFGEWCKEVFRDYPKISKYVEFYHPDTQGPLDITELLWGGEMFYELYDDPDFVHQTIDLMTNTYIKFLDRWFDLYPHRDGINAHWEYFMQGNIMLRNDSAINLSPEQYREFVMPYDKKLLDYYGSGAVHYCGKGDHFIAEMAKLDNLTGINLSQPHLNDMDKVYAAAFSNNKKILKLQAEFALDYAKRPDALPGMIYSEI